MTMMNTRTSLQKNKPMFLAIVLMLLVFFLPNLEKTWDIYIRPKPWINAELKIIPQEEPDLPLIEYKTFPRLNFDGHWKAWIKDAETGERISGGDGRGNYDPGVPMEIVWTWYAFFERHLVEPDTPYQICVSYSGETPSGAMGSFGPYCSDPYDPNT